MSGFTVQTYTASAKPKNTRSAFTLIELSIVLVIIGLIAGGVLVGKDLIQAAKLRSIMADIESYKTAANTFRLQYNCLSGDCANATNFFGQYTGNGGCPFSLDAATTADQKTCDGNGNGMIWYMETFNSFNESAERQRFWQHLSAAGLVKGQFSGIANMDGGQASEAWGSVKAGWNAPEAKMRGVAFVILHASRLAHNITAFGHVVPIALNNGHYFVLGEETRCNNGTAVCSLDIYAGIAHMGAAFTGIEALSLDKKFDDGKALTGAIRGTSWSGSAAAGGLFCSTTDDASSEYRLDSYGSITPDMKSCPLLIDAGF